MNYPKEFLHALDKQYNKIVYAKITSLSYDERPLKSIEGRVTSGSINLDGSSAVRRTCQLSMVTPEIDIANYLWGLETKFKLSIGVENQINKSYPEIIWFEQGIFLITSFSSALNTNSYTINISGKDKMCLLNGEIGGNLNSSVDFGTIEQEVEQGVWKKIKLSVYNIIREMIHTYAGEHFHNIIINDLETVGLTLQTYNYNKPMYLLKAEGSNEYTQGFINGNQVVEWPEGQQCLLSQLENNNFIFESLHDLNEQKDPNTVIWNKEKYTITKVDYGETAGYTEGDLVYPTDLIANVGETITSVLDKIKNFLGDFEYFYNLQGQFVFQKKKIYVQNIWTPINYEEDSGISIADMSQNEFAYNFRDSNLFTAFNNTPNLANLKNDFSVWGEKSTGAPIHMRYAIDNKPTFYKTIEVDDNELLAYNEKYGMNLKGQSSQLFIAGDLYREVNATKTEIEDGFITATEIGDLYYDNNTQTLYLQIQGDLSESDILELETLGKYNPSTETLTIYAESNYIICDWRELIYRMALDYNKYHHLDNFYQKVAAANPSTCVDGNTGYEQYYIDLQGFWRQLYNPFEPNIDYSYSIEDLKEIINSTEPKERKETKENIETYEKQEKYEPKTEQEKIDLERQYNWRITYYDNKNDELFGWARMIYDQPEQLLFWFDFMDTNGELSKYSTSMVGIRPKVVNDKQVRAIIYRETPNIIFQSNKQGQGAQMGYRYFNFPSGLQMFSKSAQGKSAKESIDTLLYNHSYCIESVSITSVPIYYLDVNTRIYINDKQRGIDGEYIISKISFPLSYNGTMNITATKATNSLL